MVLESSFLFFEDVAGGWERVPPSFGRHSEGEEEERRGERGKVESVGGKGIFSTECFLVNYSRKKSLDAKGSGDVERQVVEVESQKGKSRSEDGELAFRLLEREGRIIGRSGNSSNWIRAEREYERR